MILLQDSHIAHSVSKVHLIRTNNTLIELRYLFTIVNLFLSIKVDCTIVNSKLVLSEKWNRRFLQIEVDKLSQNFSAINFLLLYLNLIS